MTITPIRRKSHSNIDLHSEYANMALSLQKNPYAVEQFKPLIYKILKPLAETMGELLIQENGRRVYFAFEGKPFTDFGVIPLTVRQIHFIDHIQYYVQLLILGQDTHPKVVDVELSRLGTKLWIEKLGVGYFYETRKVGQLRNLINRMAKYAPTKDEYKYSGWMLEEDSYILNGHQLCGKDWDINRAKISCVHTLSMLDVAPHLLTIPLLAIETLSLVHSKMVDYGIYFKGVCCIVAPTQSFKTTIASLFFDSKNGLEADINFEATKAAIVRVIGNTRDSTIIVDDYKPGATKLEKNELVLKLSSIIRMCSDDSGGIQKAGIQNSTIANIARSLTVVTAEQIQLEVQSTLARLLILEMNQKDVDKGKLTYFQENHRKYREFIEDFIKFISSQGIQVHCESLVKKFLKERNILRQELLGKNILVDNRTNDMCTWLYISFNVFLEYAFDIKAITKEKFNSYIKEAYSVFVTIMEHQAELIANLDDTKRFFKALQILIETREAHIGTLQARNNSYTTMDSKSAIGFSKKKFIYLKNNVAFQQVASYYRRFGKEFAIRKKLADNGYIVAYGKKSYIHRLYVNHEIYQCIKFEESKFYELLKGGKVNESENDKKFSDNWSMYRNANNILGRRD